MKALKPPYYHVIAVCPKCGPVEVERKPHPKAGQRNDAGGVIPPEPQSIVCTCKYHAKVASFWLITQ